MSVQIALRRLGNASPMITAGLYTAVAVLVTLIDRFWSTNLALAASMGTLLRAAITVPISGGIITLARKLSAAWKRRREASLSKAPLFPTAKADSQSPDALDERSGRTT